MPTTSPSKLTAPNQASRIAEPTADSDLVSLAGCQVIVIDDDPIALRALQSHLCQRGCEVTTATDGDEGLSQISLETAVVMVDMRMPRLSGIDCLNYIGQHHPDIPVIVLTGSTDVSVAVEAMKAGAFQYITKPFQLRSSKLLKYMLPNDRLA